jgi:hypothetical protein
MSRKVFQYILAEDLQVEDIVVFGTCGNTCLVTITEIINEHGRVNVKGDNEYGHPKNFFYTTNPLVPVVCNG